MELIKWIHLPETDSTNTFLHNYQGEEGALMTVASTDFQTAGRGQGTNRWESERGKNLTFSIKTHPKDVPIRRQFIMLEAGSLALKDILDRITSGITIKWPNDIYWHDRKISGTLSECAVSGTHIKSCIFGTGLNVNQQVFVSDAPNPVSLFQITGHTTDRQRLLQQIAERMAHYLGLIDHGRYEEIDTAYLQALYRRGQWHEFSDNNGCFEGKLTGITPDGRLCITDRQETVRTYAFKEVKFIIPAVNSTKHSR